MDRPQIASIKVYPVRMTRVTAWATTCVDCDGTALSRNSKMAVEAAKGHARSEHGGNADINVRKA